MSRKKSSLRLALTGAALTGGAVLFAGCGGGQSNARAGTSTQQQVYYLPGLPGQTGPAGLTGPSGLNGPSPASHSVVQQKDAAPNGQALPSGTPAANSVSARVSR